MPDYGYSKVTDDQNATLKNLAMKFAVLESYITSVVPAGRRQSLAITHLEEAAMWASKAIAKPEPVKNELPRIPEQVDAPWPDSFGNMWSKPPRHVGDTQPSTPRTPETPSPTQTLSPVNRTSRNTKPLYHGHVNYPGRGIGAVFCAD